MRTLLLTSFIMLLAAPVFAETYSWVDDKGTYNFTEDYSSVPKKYRNKVQRREDLPKDVNPRQSPQPGSAVKATDSKDEKPVEGEGKLYGGKSRADWQKEMNVQEAELNSIQQRIELLRKQIYDTRGIGKVQFDVLKKDYDDSRAEYQQKYKNYSDLMETIRKAGITVDIKK